MAETPTNIAAELKIAAEEVAILVSEGHLPEDEVAALDTDEGLIVALPMGLGAAMWLCSNGKSRSIYGFCADHETLAKVPVREPLYAVWYASAGCLPDSPGPEFWGTLDECKRWVDENAEDYERPEVEHDLYSLTIEPYEPEEEEL